MLGANAMWGLMSPVAKLVMAGGLISPLILTDLRMAGAMTLFWLLSLFTKPEHVRHDDHLRLFFASMLATVCNQGCFLFGVQLSSPGNASLITTSMPLWAMLLAAFYLKEPVTGKKVLGLAAGACGALTLILGSSGNQAESADGGHAAWGDLLVVAAQLSYASYLVFFKNFVAKYSLVTIMKWLFTYAFIVLLPFSGRELAATPWALLDGRTLLGIAYVVVCGTFLCYMLTVIGQKTLRPTVAGMYNYVQPVVAGIVAVCWGMDRLTPAKGIAVVLIFSGVYLVTISRSREDMKQRARQAGS